MFSKDIYEELAYKFAYLSNLKPDNVKTRFDIFDTVLTDSFLHNFNPKRYMFYMEFLKALKDPQMLKKIIYENKLIKAKKEDEAKLLNEIVAKLNQLYTVTDKNMFANDDVFADYKREKIENENKQLVQRLGAVMEEYKPESKPSQSGTESADKNNQLITILQNTFQNTSNITGGAITEDEMKQNMQKIEAYQNDNNRDFKTYMSQIEKVKQNFENTSLLNDYKTKLQTVLEAPTGDDKMKARKLQDIINDIEDNEMTSIKSLEVTKEDRLIFVGITFMIRLLVLTIIDWSLTTNFVVNFFQAFMLYIGMYFVFILLIIVVVNLTYNVSIYNLYTDKHSLFTSLAGSLYYFYIIPGNFLGSSKRILIHLGLIFFMTIIALFISYNGTYTQDEINYDYSEKKRIKRQLNNFTLILWAFTSAIAMVL